MHTCQQLPTALTATGATLSHTAGDIRIYFTVNFLYRDTTVLESASADGHMSEVSDYLC
jgi:hypothetical protein